MTLKTTIVVAVATVALLHHYKLDARLANAIAPPAHATGVHYQKTSLGHPHAGVGKLSSSGFESCPQFFYQGTPPAMADAGRLKPRALCYDAFAVLHSGVTHTPIYVAEHLTKAHLVEAKEETRTNKFFADARLPSAERAELEDYHASGYDRGHMQYPAENVLNA